ncbi:uncharacterized protein BDW43DRAFT_20170 [Aspergillus alliaceus]|uniref:uncharacterized protein n=1 Tax=Petromyces alliaceus TaxID=209559 RepID=UPI0012A5D9E5|nr:uncharacterized protein BDW43DRAFT_20170 [Aspergillus alliaceus]KAB8236076.1 hypothetical protein BDW43DRAFT_20170 [Aspergillus alliaceus]
MHRYNPCRILPIAHNSNKTSSQKLTSRSSAPYLLFLFLAPNIHLLLYTSVTEPALNFTAHFRPQFPG